MPRLRLCDICSGGLKSALVSTRPGVGKRRRGSGALVGGTYLAWLLVRKQAKLREQWLGRRGPILFLPRRQGLEPQGGGMGCESGHGCPHPGDGVPCSTPPSITKGLISHWRQQTPLGMTGATWPIPWAGLQPSCLMPSLPPSSVVLSPVGTGQVCVAPRAEPLPGLPGPGAGPAAESISAPLGWP